MTILSAIAKQEQDIEDFGFYWENVAQILDQIRSECAEVQEAYLKGDRQHTQEEVGDIINAAISLCVFLKFDPAETLQKTRKKFADRYDIMQALVKQDGLQDLQGQPTQTLLTYWEKAKKIAYEKK